MRRSTSSIFLLVSVAWLTTLLSPTDLQAQCGTNTALGGQSGCARSNFYLGEYLPNSGCGVATSIPNYGPGYYFRMPVLQGGCYTVSTCGAGVDTQINAFQGTNTTGPFAYCDDNGPYCATTAASIIMTPNFTDYARVDVRQYPCAAGGSSSITVQLWQNNNLSITSSSSNMCEGQTRSLTATPATVTAVPQPNSGDVGTFSGTGVSGTTFTAPTPGSSSAAYNVTYAFGYCTTTQSITVFRNPTVANAGPDQAVCGNTATLAANAATYGTGAWSIVSGPGSITTPASPTSGVTGLVSGTPTTLRWTISNGPCSASTDDVVLTVDAVNPSITCPANISLANTSGQCAATGTFTAPVGTDNCPGSTTAQTAGLASGSTFPVGTTVNTFRVTDSQGRTATCSFNITVTDVQVPAITCPANMSVNTVSGTCSATATYSTPSGSDNCPGVTSTQTAGLASGATYPLGVTTNTFRATDAAGLTSTCAFTVTVVDAEAPALTCPANASITAATGTCSATFTYTAPTGSDNCAGATTTQTAGLASGATFPLGATTNTFRATDAAGNSTTCSFTVTVNDGEAPAITCPANGNATAATGSCAAAYTYTTPSGTDNCAGATTTQTAGLASGASFPVGTTTNIFRTTDAAGNTTTCAFSVTVTDAESPAITCPANASVSTSVGTCTATYSYTAPSGTDNCAGATTTQTAGLPSGSTFPLGTTSNAFRVTDAAGNSTTCAFDVTVVDAEAPAITCPANASVNASTGTCSASYSYTAPSGTDNCTSATVTQTTGLASGATFPVGATTNTFQATDAAGNSSTCAFTVTVMDAEAPAITCPANASVNATTGVCGAAFTYSTPSGTDNCTGATTTQTAGLASGATFPVGTTANTFRTTDLSGNSSTCSFNVTVTDAELPTLNCPATISVNADPGNCSASVTYTAPAGTDNCPGVTTTQTTGLASGSVFPVGTTVNAFQATDAAANSSTCSFTVVVLDNQAPAITCPANITTTSQTGACGAAVTYPTPSGTDNCSGATTAQTAGLPSGATFPVGSTTVTFATTDASANSASCTFSVTVTDAESPTWSNCPANITAGTGPTCTANVNWTAPTAADNCTVSSTSSTHTPGASFGTGTVAVVYTATDASGNTATCAFNVTVNDNTPPTALCTFVVVSLDSSGNGSITEQDVDAGSSDNCGSVTLSLSQLNFTCANAGNNVLTLTVTDQSGNTATCTANISVVPPVMSGTITADTTSCGYNLSCNGASDGIAHAQGLGGCPGYTYLWSNGATTATATGLPAGISTVTITDGTGATDVQTVNLNAPVALSATGTATGTCPGTTDGAIDLTANGGNDCQPYTFLWSTGASTEDIGGLAPGSYTVTVTDANGCTTTQTITVPTFAVPNPTFTQNGMLLTSNQTWVTYQWLLNGGPISGANASTYTVQQTGSYSLQATDTNGCSGISDTTNVTFVGTVDPSGDWASMSIYPNPARGQFRLRTDMPIAYPITLRVTDIYGRTVAQKDLPELAHETTISLDRVASGTYLVEVTSDQGHKRVWRLVVQ